MEMRREAGRQAFLSCWSAAMLWRRGRTDSAVGGCGYPRREERKRDRKREGGRGEREGGKGGERGCERVVGGKHTQMQKPQFVWEGSFWRGPDWFQAKAWVQKGTRPNWRLTTLPFSCLVWTVWQSEISVFFSFLF